MYRVGQIIRGQKEVIPQLPPSTQLLGEQDSSAVSPSKDQSERSDSTTPNPRPVTKKARIIESGEDLLKDVKKSYAFVCGADIFSPPTRPCSNYQIVYMSTWHIQLQIITAIIITAAAYRAEKVLWCSASSVCVCVCPPSRDCTPH